MFETRAEYARRWNRNVHFGGGAALLLFIACGLTMNAITGNNGAPSDSSPKPKTPAEAPLSPQLQSAPSSPKPQTGPKVLLGAAQREIEATMKDASIPVLSTNRSGFNNPSSSKALAEFLDQRAAAYSKRANVAPNLGAATTHCSTLVTQSRGNDPSEATVQRITDSFAQGDMGNATAACKQGVLEAWRDGIIYFNMPAAGE